MGNYFPTNADFPKMREYPGLSGIMRNYAVFPHPNPSISQPSTNNPFPGHTSPTGPRRPPFNGPLTTRPDADVEADHQPIQLSKNCDGRFPPSPGIGLG